MVLFISKKSLTNLYFNKEINIDYKLSISLALMYIILISLNFIKVNLWLVSIILTLFFYCLHFITMVTCIDDFFILFICKIYILFLGIILGYVRIKFGLLYAIYLHVGYNFVIYMLYILN